MKRQTTFVGVLVCFTLCGCGGGSAGTGASNNSPSATPPLRFSVSGTVTDRIDGSPISGSTVAFRGLSGTGTGTVSTAAVVDGSYALGELVAGTYEVTIAGSSHVEHKNSSYNLSTGRNDFTVLEFGSCRAGACFDVGFPDYFRWVGRNEANTASSSWYGKMHKWTTLPKEIWVVNAEHSVPGEEGITFRAMPQEELDGFLKILNEVNEESIPAMFCGAIGPLPVVVRSPTPNRFEPGVIIVRFETQTARAPRQVTTEGVITASNAYWTSSGWTQLSARGRIERKYVVAHELFHTAFANHAYGHARMDGLMDAGLIGIPTTPTALSSEERLAACIVYHADTHPGNAAPDTNPK